MSMVLLLIICQQESCILRQSSQYGRINIAVGRHEGPYIYDALLPSHGRRVFDPRRGDRISMKATCYTD